MEEKEMAKDVLKAIKEGLKESVLFIFIFGVLYGITNCIRPNDSIDILLLIIASAWYGEKLK